MNRRGFLTALAALGAEPLIPKGTAFSFLGGIFRPTWTEVPAAWPLHLELRGEETLTLAEGTFSLPAMSYIISPTLGGNLFNPTSRHDNFIGVIHGLGAPEEWPNGAQLLRNRSGDYRIQAREKSS